MKQEYIDRALLRLEPEEIEFAKKLANPLDLYSDSDPDLAGFNEIRLMRMPEYLFWAANLMLRIKQGKPLEMTPIHALVLEELWRRPFPMLIASRGFGKAILCNDKVLVKDGWKKMGDVELGEEIYSRNGELCKITDIFPQGKKRVCELTLLDGRKLECCEDHLWVVKKGNKEKVVDTKEIINSGVKWTNGSTTYKYRIPNCEPINYPIADLSIDPYILGCLLGDGSMKSLTPKIASDDDFIINEFKNKLKDFEIKKDKTNNNYTIVDKNKTLSTISRSNGSTYKTRSRNRLTQLIKKLKLNVKTDRKFIPREYKRSSIEQRMELVRGLMDTDGSINSDGSIEFTNTCEQLTDDLIEVLRSLGITCRKGINDRSGQFQKMPQGTIRERTPYFRIYINTSQPIFKLPRKLKRIKKYKTSSEDYVSIIDAKYTDRYEDMQCITVDSPDNTFIMKDHTVTHNTVSLAIYNLLKMRLVPGTKIVAAGAAFRQSKLIFEYMETIWRNSPVLRSTCNLQKDGPKRGVDRCEFRIGESLATFIPLGDGCLSYDVPITYENRFGYIGDSIPENIDLQQDHQVFDNTTAILSEDGFRESDEKYYNGIRDILDIETDKGYQIGGTYNHKIKILRNNKIEWCRFDELKVNDYVQINRRQTWHNGKEDFGVNDSYACGLLVGDGCWTDKYKLSFATTDQELINSIRSYIDKDFKDSDKYHFHLYSKQKKEAWCDKWEFPYKCYTKDKYFPKPIMRADKKCMTAFIQGLFDTDGTLQVNKSKGGTSITVSFCNTSEKLVKQLQYILTHYGIISTVSNRNRQGWNTIYELFISGKNVNLFADQIGFRLKRKQNKLATALSEQNRNISSSDIIPNIQPILLSIANKYSNSFKGPEGSPSSIKARKNITQSYLIKFLQRYGKCNHPKISLLKELSNLNIFYDKIKKIEKSKKQPTYDLHVPSNHTYIAGGFISHNSKIRGLRGTTIEIDEFDSVNPEIYETVIAGFGAVEKDPVESAALEARRELLIKAGEWTEDDEDKYAEKATNQSIITGTAGYSFGSFARYFHNYQKIIKSRGDDKALKEILGEKFNKDFFDYRDYSILRIPYNLIPRGFMSDKTIARAKATSTSDSYEREYECIFSKDSQGYFRRSLIEACTASKQNNIVGPDNVPIVFDARITGDLSKKYIYGIDPASEDDNLAIVIIELHENHSRVVYCWTVNKKKFEEKIKAGITHRHDYFQYCADHIRNLMTVFPCVRIMMDAQGGGSTLREAFANPRNGEMPIFEVIEKEKAKITDKMQGLHILEMCQFVRKEWTSQANVGLKFDMEKKLLLFPQFDSISLATSYEDDVSLLKARGIDYDIKHANLYDTKEDCVIEIEKLKEELTTVVYTKTSGGTERWDTPEIKMADGKKGRLKKDRYSALVMANMGARQEANKLAAPPIHSAGWGAVGKPSKHKDQPKSLYQSKPPWYNPAKSMFKKIQRR